ncbi:DMT family transporter, partial [Bacillus thuringiensis]
LFNNISFSVLGASITIALSLLGQSIASIVIDHFGLLGMKVAKCEKKKLIGLCFISSGIIIMTIY